MVYTSSENSKIKNIKKLNESKHRNNTNQFLVEGEHLVLEAYKKGYIQELILLENNEYNLDVPTIYVSEKVLKYISSLDTPQSIMAICNKKEDTNNIGKHIMMLDEIQDPGNLGTIIRSALAFNIDTLILSNNSVDLYNPKVIRASQGMIFHLNIITCDLIDKIHELKEDNYQIIGSDVNGGTDIKNFEKEDKFVIIMGNEGQGISKEILDLCDTFVHINMSDKCESLNVGVAAGIILYELDK
jgi:TrmH family RNA methyltransferase